MSKATDAIKVIEEETGMRGLLKRILYIGKKRTEILDDSGINSKQAVMKTEDGFEYPARCYAYVPDDEMVSTWKLRLCAPETTEITREQLGAAAAAFSEGGFRGQRVDLPGEDVPRVRRRIRNEYAKLNVDYEDMPESIKSMEVVMDELKEKLAEKAKAYSGTMREKMDAILSEMEKAESDQVAMVRQLAELIAQIEDEELRVGLEEIVMAMQKILMPDEEESEIEDESEMEVLESAPDEKASCETEEKQIDLVEELQLDKLSEMLEVHNKAIASNSEKIEYVKVVAEAIEELVNKNKALFEKVEGLENDIKRLSEKAIQIEEETKELAKEDEQKIAEKQARFVPFWASRYEASKAAETVLDENEAKNYAKPQVPSPIQGLTDSYLRRK